MKTSSRYLLYKVYRVCEMMGWREGDFWALDEEEKLLWLAYFDIRQEEQAWAMEQAARQQRQEAQKTRLRLPRTHLR